MVLVDVSAKDSWQTMFPNANLTDDKCVLNVSVSNRPLIDSEYGMIFGTEVIAQILQRNSVILKFRVT